MWDILLIFTLLWLIIFVFYLSCRLAYVIERVDCLEKSIYNNPKKER